MEYQFLETRIENNVLIVTLAREDQLNALNRKMIGEIRQLFEALDKDLSGIRGVVMTGKGNKAFAAGADIKELTILNVDEAYMISQDVHTTFDLIVNFRIPVIAAINGYALGGGFEVALACHIRVANSSARIGLPESTLGLIPGYGGTQRLTRIVGRARAIELICSGEMVQANEAAELNIVSHVTEPGKEVEKAVEIIEKMTRYAHESVGKVFEATLLHDKQPEDGCRYERKAVAELLQSKNAKEGMLAFMEKRKPEFQRD